MRRSTLTHILIVGIVRNQPSVSCGLWMVRPPRIHLSNRNTPAPGTIDEDSVITTSSCKIRRIWIVLGHRWSVPDLWLGAHVNYNQIPSRGMREEVSVTTAIISPEEQIHP